MSITAERKKELIGEFARADLDTGSPEVQIAVLTARINNLTGHFKENHHDFSSRRGLLKMVGRRRRLLNYLIKTDNETYKALISKLGIRK